jgi:hypothetical protein
MPYTAQKPEPPESPDELRARIPGWGVDSDPADRPSVPKERFDLGPTGAHWEFPERQEELTPRERSIEHAMLTPVFGTAQPLKGLSGLIRRRAYDRYSEGQLAHWLLLVLGDRVDAVESHLVSFATLRPDNPITETGVLAEAGHRPLRSRFGVKRADLKHMWMDPFLVAGPWIAGGIAVAVAASKVAKRSRG